MIFASSRGMRESITATTRLVATLLLGSALLACPVERRAEDPQQTGQPTGGEQPVDARTVGQDTANVQGQARRPQAEQRLRVEVHQGAREGRVYLDGQRVRTFRVAVGQADHPTPTGDFTIHQVDWNPDWRPPDSEWAADRSYKRPGEEGNPMGRVRMIYQAPFSLHGTDNIESLGGAESHGAIRVANSTIIELGRLVMEHGGERRDEQWFRRVLDNRTEMVRVELQSPVALTIRE